MAQNRAQEGKELDTLRVTAKLLVRKITYLGNVLSHH